jgi:hypothetical protein
MTKIVLALISLAVLFGSAEVSDASSQTPYWAGHKAELSADTDDGRWCNLTIEYSKDGKQYSAFLKMIPGRTRSCSGLVDQSGNIERKDCTPNSRKRRDIVGTVTNPILFIDASTVKCKWDDRALQKKQKTILAKHTNWKTIRSSKK